MFRNKNISTDLYLILLCSRQYGERTKRMPEEKCSASYKLWNTNNLKSSKMAYNAYRYMRELNPINLTSITDFNMIIVNAIQQQQKSFSLCCLLLSLHFAIHPPGYIIWCGESLYYRESIALRDMNRQILLIAFHSTQYTTHTHTHNIYDDTKLVNCARAC